MARESHPYGGSQWDLARVRSTGPGNCSYPALQGSVSTPQERVLGWTHLQTLFHKFSWTEKGSPLLLSRPSSTVSWMTKLNTAQLVKAVTGFTTALKQQAVRMGAELRQGKSVSAPSWSTDCEKQIHVRQCFMHTWREIDGTSGTSPAKSSCCPLCEVCYMSGLPFPHAMHCGLSCSDLPYISMVLAQFSIIFLYFGSMKNIQVHRLKWSAFWWFFLYLFNVKRFGILRKISQIWILKGQISHEYLVRFEMQILYLRYYIGVMPCCDKQKIPAVNKIIHVLFGL